MIHNKYFFKIVSLTLSMVLSSTGYFGCRTADEVNSHVCYSACLSPQVHINTVTLQAGFKKDIPYAVTKVSNPEMKYFSLSHPNGTHEVPFMKDFSFLADIELNERKTFKEVQKELNNGTIIVNPITCYKDKAAAVRGKGPVEVVGVYEGEDLIWQMPIDGVIKEQSYVDGLSGKKFRIKISVCPLTVGKLQMTLSVGMKPKTDDIAATPILEYATEYGAEVPSVDILKPEEVGDITPRLMMELYYANQSEQSELQQENRRRALKALLYFASMPENGFDGRPDERVEDAADCLEAISNHPRPQVRTNLAKDLRLFEPSETVLMLVERIRKNEKEPDPDVRREAELTFYHFTMVVLVNALEHNLRNPLVSIGGFAKRLLRQLHNISGSQEDQEAARQIKKSFDRIVTAVDTMERLLREYDYDVTYHTTDTLTLSLLDKLHYYVIICESEMEYLNGLSDKDKSFYHIQTAIVEEHIKNLKKHTEVVDVLRRAVNVEDYEPLATDDFISRCKAACDAVVKAVNEQNLLQPIRIEWNILQEFSPDEIMTWKGFDKQIADIIHFAYNHGAGFVRFEIGREERKVVDDTFQRHVVLTASFNRVYDKRCDERGEPGEKIPLLTTGDMPFIWELYWNQNQNVSLWLMRKMLTIFWGNAEIFQAEDDGHKINVLKLRIPTSSRFAVLGINLSELNRVVAEAIPGLEKLAGYLEKRSPMQPIVQALLRIMKSIHSATGWGPDLSSAIAELRKNNDEISRLVGRVERSIGHDFSSGFYFMKALRDITPEDIRLFFEGLRIDTDKGDRQLLLEAILLSAGPAGVSNLRPGDILEKIATEGFLGDDEKNERWRTIRDEKFMLGNIKNFIEEIFARSEHNAIMKFFLYDLKRDDLSKQRIDITPDVFTYFRELIGKAVDEIEQEKKIITVETVFEKMTQQDDSFSFFLYNLKSNLTSGKQPGVEVGVEELKEAVSAQIPRVMTGEHLNTIALQILQKTLAILGTSHQYPQLCNPRDIIEEIIAPYKKTLPGHTTIIGEAFLGKKVQTYKNMLEIVLDQVFESLNAAQAEKIDVALNEENRALGIKITAYNPRKQVFGPEGGHCCDMNLYKEINRITGAEITMDYEMDEPKEKAQESRLVFSITMPLYANTRVLPLKPEKKAQNLGKVRFALGGAAGSLKEETAFLMGSQEGWLIGNVPMLVKAFFYKFLSNEPNLKSRLKKLNLKGDNDQELDDLVREFVTKIQLAMKAELGLDKNIKFSEEDSMVIYNNVRIDQVNPKGITLRDEINTAFGDLTLWKFMHAMSKRAEFYLEFEEQCFLMIEKLLDRGSWNGAGLIIGDWTWTMRPGFYQIFLVGSADERAPNVPLGHAFMKSRDIFSQERRRGMEGLSSHLELPIAGLGAGSLAEQALQYLEKVQQDGFFLNASRPQEKKLKQGVMLIETAI